jgi:hypothetical protein
MTTGRSITSTATVSTAGATGGFTFRAAFFTGARLGLAVRFVAFVDLATLRALPCHSSKQGEYTVLHGARPPTCSAVEPHPTIFA